MSIDRILDAIKGVQEQVEDEKEHLNNGEYLRLCNATQRVYNCANAIKTGEPANEEEEDNAEASEAEEDDDEELMTEEEEEPERERTEDDMGVNELSELWESQFDFGRPNAVLELEGLIYEIVESTEAKRVCAAVRVLNRAMKGSKPDDPEDAERILEWKEELVAQRAIRVCAEILEEVDGRGFHNEHYEDYWHYSIICDEILELFQRLGEGDALYRTKLRRNGALKGVKEHKRAYLGEAVLEMLQQR